MADEDERPEEEGTQTVVVPISVNRLLRIEHRLTKLELGMAIIGAVAGISLGGIVILVADVVAKGIP